MALVAERPHNKHESSVFVRDGLKLNSISVREEDNVEFTTVKLLDVVVHSVYKPPAPSTLKQKHASYCNLQFNSHNTLWGYTSTDNDGEAVELCAESNNISLIHNAKLS